MLKDYKVKKGESIYNIAINLYGDVSYAYKLAFDNSITLESDLSELILIYDSSIKENVLEPLIINPIREKNMLQTYVSKFGQSIFDVTLNLTGSLENVLSVVKNSNMDNINNSLDSSYSFIYSQSKSPLVRYTDKNKIVFTTGIQLQTAKKGEFDISFDQQAFS